MIFVYVLLALIFIVSVILAIYGCRDNSSYDEDAVIVLGYGVKDERTPPMLKKRLDKTVEYHCKNPDAVIIVSGGRGNGTKPSEASVMEKYLVSNGVPSDKIIIEDKSCTTIENFRFSAEIINKKLGRNCSAVLITNIFHIYRSEKYAKIFGINVRHIAAKTNWYDIPWIYIREFALVVHMLITIGRLSQ